MTLQKKATVISSLVAFALVCMKITVWIFSGSIAVLSSAIDSMLDFFVSLFNFFALKESEKWKDKKYNYWRWKIEAIASLVEWWIISLSALYILYESISKLIIKEEIKHLSISIYVMIISLFITTLLVFFLLWVAKKTWNLVIKSDALHYKTDVLSNLWILVWLVIIKFTGFEFIDSIIWIIISVYIWYSAFWIIKSAYNLLMDKSIDESELKKIIEILDNQKWINSYHLLQTRKAVWLKCVSVHLVFSPSTMLIEAHKISHLIENKIKKIDPETSWDIITHLDPYDDKECDEFEN